MATDSRNPFNILPIETTQHIASLLEYDTDICNFRRICKSTADAVDADNCTFWRRRFVAHFEDCRWPRSQNEKYRTAYQNRKRLLKNGAVFITGETKREKKCLELLRDLMVESFSGKAQDPKPMAESLNLQHIKRFLLANDVLNVIFMPKPPRASNSRFNASSSRRCYSPTKRAAEAKSSDLLLTTQILCAPMLLSFEPHLADAHFGFPDSQAVCYSAPTTWPIFGGANGLDVNMEFILHNLNFWKYHMLRKEEQTLYWAFRDLDDDERPRWWSSQLPQQGAGAGGKKLGKHWKGSYAYIGRDEVYDMRSGQRDITQISDQIQDSFAGEDAASFQDLHLSLIDAASASEFPWPDAFERHLHSLSAPPSTSRAKTRAQKRHASPESIASLLPQSFRFDGNGTDVSEAFYAAGWLNPLPEQQGVPGWQRMTMMKYFEDETDPLGVDVNALWAYEGVVLPGGEIVVGRWWSPTNDGEVDVDEVYSGPFILWCVDGAKYEALDMEGGEDEMGGS